MNDFDKSLLKKLYIPPIDSHKGQNGKLLVIGGSHLFHAAPLWSLKIASKLVDMVYFSSVPENNEIIQKIKSEFLDGIVVKREHLKNYIGEADCILIGPGLPRKEGLQQGDDDTKELTENLLKNYPEKKWVIDGGSLQEIDPETLLNLKVIPILTPHVRELEILKLKSKKPSLSVGRSKVNLPAGGQNSKLEEQARVFAKEYNCVVLLKGVEDIVCPPFGFAQSETQCLRVSGGNAGMTKGGTGDVLAGLTAAFYCKNDAFLSATCASYINKKAGDSLFEKVGYYFNSSDLIDEIPKVMKQLVVGKSVR